MGEQVDGGRDLLQQRAEMARRLRQKLTDPLFRSAVKGRCIPDSPGPRCAESSWPSNSPRAVSHATPPLSPQAASQASSSGRASSLCKARQPNVGSHTLARQLARRSQQQPSQTPSSSLPQWDNRVFVDSAPKKQSLRNSFTGSSTPSSPRVQRLSSSSSAGGGSSQLVRKVARPHSAGAISKSEGVASRRQAALNAQPIPLRGRRNEAAPEVRPRASSEKTVQRPSSAGRQPSTQIGWHRSSRQSLQEEDVVHEAARRSSQQSLQEEDGTDGRRDGLELQQQLQAAGEHILSLEREQRELIGNGLRTIALSSLTSLTTPGSPPAKHLEAAPNANETQSLARKSLAESSVSPVDETSPVRCSRAESRWSIFSEAGLPGESRTSDAERPTWLLQDGRLRAARLEGENHALRKAVARARSENDELAERRRVAEERSEHLQSVSESLCLALLDIARLGEASPAASAQAVEAVDKASTTVAAINPAAVLRPSAGNGMAVESLRRAVNLKVSSSTSSTPSEALRPVPSQPPMPVNSSTAAESLRRVVNAQVQPTGTLRREEKDVDKFFYIGSPQSPQAVVQQEEVARSRLLETTLNVGARMEEIFARRSKLQVLCDTKVSNSPNAAIDTEPPTEAGSTAPSGESVEGIFPFATF